MAVLIIDNPFDLPNGVAASAATAPRAVALTAATLQSEAFFADTVAVGPTTEMAAAGSAPMAAALPATTLAVAPAPVALPAAATLAMPSAVLTSPLLAVGTAQPLVTTATASPAISVHEPSLDIANVGSPHMVTTADTGLFGFV